jgi:hypothetical protein
MKPGTIDMTITRSRRTRVLLSVAVAASLFATALAPAPEAHAVQLSPATSYGSVTQRFDDAERAKDVQAGLELLDSIPDDVLSTGDAGTAAWFREHAGAAEGAERAWDTMQASVLGCSAAIAMVIASTAIPAAKILRVKRLIDELGGVATAVQILWGASFSYEKLQAVGGAALALAGELLGITSIQTECFS